MNSGLNRAELIGRIGADVTVNHIDGDGRIAARLVECQIRAATRCLAHWSAGRPAYLSHQTFLPEM